MDDESTIIIGAGGQLGKAWSRSLPNARAVDSEELDLSSSKAIRDFNWHGIKLILNAAAYTAVDSAETIEGRPQAWKVNAEAVGELARIATENNMTLVHISTDYVFDGTKEEYSEDDDLCPLGVYGQTKAAGDLLAATTKKHYILRTSWVIGDGKNFIKTMCRLAEDDINPTVVDDQYGRLTFADTLAEAAIYLIKNKAPYGIYNTTNSGLKSNWFEIACRVFEHAGFDPQRITSSDTDSYFKKARSEGKSIAIRPANSMLNLAKLEATGFIIPLWDDALKQYLNGEAIK